MKQINFPYWEIYLLLWLYIIESRNGAFRFGDCRSNTSKIESPSKDRTTEIRVRLKPQTTITTALVLSNPWVFTSRAAWIRDFVRDKCKLRLLEKSSDEVAHTPLTWRFHYSRKTLASAEPNKLVLLRNKKSAQNWGYWTNEIVNSPFFMQLNWCRKCQQLCNAGVNEQRWKTLRIRIY